ncbi:MAG: DUF1080 domain-containing protein [Bryobacterales bacterium]|nr:DUF1080 domain-containing protein [Bryobacterales bacterium]
MREPLWSRRRLLLTLAASPGLAAAQSGANAIFDGRSLAGWTIADGPPTAFYVEDGAIVAHRTSAFPTWLRYNKELENFDFSCEFFVKGWTDGAVYVHAPEFGRRAETGMAVKIFHQVEPQPLISSAGAILGVLPPRRIAVRPEWNTLRIAMDWPSLKVWMNGEIVQDVNADEHPELRYRLRRGYLGLSPLGYEHRFRNLTLRELPSKTRWEPLFETDRHLEENWWVSESRTDRAPVKFQAINGILRGEGIGHIATKKQYRDFDLSMYVRGPAQHNSGVLFRTEGKGLEGKRHYEIQIHNVEEAHFPTGSLYYRQRAAYPRIQDNEWFPLQLIVEGPRCVVRVNGDTVMTYARLDDTAAGHIELQAHAVASWIEFRQVRVRAL